MDKCILEIKKPRSFENSSPDPCFSKLMVKRRNIGFRVEVWKMGNRFRITGVEVVLYYKEQILSSFICDSQDFEYDSSKRRQYF